MRHHDRDATNHDQAAIPGPARDAGLQAALDDLRLDGAIFLRAEYTEAWAYQSPPTADLITLLRPGAERLVLFHIVAAGELWIALEGGERHWASQGDVIVLPYGGQHAMGGQAEAAQVPIAELLDPPPWREFPVIRHGGGGPRTDVVCGYLQTDDPLFDPALRALPPVFVVHPAPATASWVQASVAYATQPAQLAQPSRAATRLPELLLTEMLRLHLSTAPAADAGLLAALRDPVLAPALAALHRSPDRKWTVTDLAAQAKVSRSLLDQRFRDQLGRSPIRYLTQWRMHIAQDLLRSTDATVAAISRRVGYESEEAFSRAFKRESGRSPDHWRRERHHPAGQARPATTTAAPAAG